MLIDQDKIRVAVVLLAVTAATSLYAAGAGVNFPFDRVTGEYEDVEVSTAPTSSGALDVHLSSSENLLRLESGSLRFEPAEDGLHKAELVVTFSGEGQLVTEITVGSLPARFEDEMLFPRQQQSITAWVEIEAIQEGYRVTTRRMPETIAVDVESARAGDLVELCRSISLFFVGDAGCEALESILAHPKLPLPKPGSEFVVARSVLTADEIERLDLYLAGSKLSAVSR